jgi:mRNA-degrading endonuclease RelE of RelBE toxin-antitoxin system
MSRSIFWSHDSIDDSNRLDVQTRERIIDAIERLALTDVGDVVQLQGSGEYRLRVGQWRVRFLYGPRRESIEVLRILPRDKAYRD